MKKDKRLLVLLALGAIIILSDLEIIPSTETIPAEGYMASWTEVKKGETNLLYRMSPSGKTRNGSQNGLTKAPVSPRLAFFLGMPFPINQASADDLVLVRGIGPALAENIIQYRQDNGPITSPGELEKIPGIGPKMKQRLQEFFTYTDDSE